MTIKIKRDTAANWASANPVLALGQPGHDTTNNQIRVGNGASVWSALSPIGGGGGGAVAWGGITGTLSDQIDLQAALDGKQALSAVLTATTASYTIAEQAKLSLIAAGATVNSPDATLLLRANHTGTQDVATITGLATVATSGSAADLSAGILPAARFDDTAHGARAGGTLHANVIAAGASGFMTGADKTKLDGVAAGAQVNVATDLTYTAATRVLASSTGVDATLPIVTTTDAGLAPATGGGTTNFLRADGTWAAPSGGGSVTVQDEGVNITTGLSTLNFVGAGVAVTGGATATVTIPGGGGGSAVVYEETIDFTVGRRSGVFAVNVPGALTSQRVVASISGNMPGGVSFDELEMDPLAVTGYVSAADTVTLMVNSLGGPIRGQRNINMMIG